MYILVHVPSYCYIRFRVPEKGSSPNEQKFSHALNHVINTLISAYIYENEGIIF